jgi:exonuclease III
MRLFLLNANSLNNKVWQFESEILMYHGYPEFVAITETWLTNMAPSDIFKFNAYSVYRRDRVNDAHGGVMFLVKNGLASEQISRESQIEILWVMVYFGAQRMVFGVYYRAHVSHVHEFEQLRQELEFIVNRYPNVPIVLVGDFNMPDINWTEGVSACIYKQDEYLDLFLNII